MDKIVVAGDSIAYGKWDKSGGWVSRFRKYVDEKYNLGVDGNTLVFNISVPGEVAPRLSQRLGSELKYRLIEKERNLVIVAVGLNDSNPNGWMQMRKTPPEEFVKSYLQIFKTIEGVKGDILVLSLTPVDDSKLSESGFTEQAASEYNNLIVDSCRKRNVPYLDIAGPLEKKGYKKYLIDGVHPSDEGHKLIAGEVVEYFSENF